MITFEPDLPNAKFLSMVEAWNCIKTFAELMKYQSSPIIIDSAVPVAGMQIVGSRTNST